MGHYVTPPPLSLMLSLELQTRPNINLYAHACKKMINIKSAINVKVICDVYDQSCTTRLYFMILCYKNSSCFNCKFEHNGSLQQTNVVVVVSFIHYYVPWLSRNQILCNQCAWDYSDGNVWIICFPPLLIRILAI